MRLINKIDIFEAAEMLEDLGVKNHWKELIIALYTDIGILFDNTCSYTFKETLAKLCNYTDKVDDIADYIIHLANMSLPDTLPDNVKGYCISSQFCYELLLFEND